MEHDSLPLLYLDTVDSTNTWAKHNLDRFPRGGAVYTASQTAGRGRLGRAWVNADGQALYYTAVITRPLADPAALPLYASLAIAGALRRRYGVDCRIKWPNDLLLNGKKIVGILCETVALGEGRAALAGIGVNLCQPQSYFDAAGLPHGASLALLGARVDPARDPEALAKDMTEGAFGPGIEAFARLGFGACRDQYRAACVNLGRRVRFDGGEGTAVDIDGEGRLVVKTDAGVQKVFTGEVTVGGIYGAL